MDKVMLLIEIAKGKKTQKELARVFSTTQQTISYNLKQLESEGFIKEGEITEKGKRFLKSIQKEIAKIFFEKPIKIRGEVFSGYGEGKKYLGMKEYKEKIKKELGFSPYEGTLNIRIDEKDLEKRERIINKFTYIEGFEKNGRKYGGLFALTCFINGVEAAVIIPIRSRYGYEVLEVISPYYLREKLNVKDGDEVEVVFS